MPAIPDLPIIASPLLRAGDLPRIIAEWELLGREEPWHIDPHRFGIDALHETIAAIVEISSWGGSGPFAAERLVRSAAAHGQQRRAQDAGDDAVLREYHALRMALWRFLQNEAPAGPAAIATILRVDVAIGVATTIALRGYHRSAMPGIVSWEADVLEQIQAVSRHLGDLLHDRIPA